MSVLETVCRVCSDHACLKLNTRNLNIIFCKENHEPAEDSSAVQEIEEIVGEEKGEVQGVPINMGFSDEFDIVFLNNSLI